MAQLAENALTSSLNVDLDLKIRYINHALPPKTRRRSGTSVFDYIDPSERDAVEGNLCAAAKRAKPSSTKPTP
ncbi:MAG: hypothetical protein H6617_12215 [Bdellovibrionaceae bacterium]|nr:hypothetical protein [Pseudobdellovibrionaceae bacterium]